MPRRPVSAATAPQELTRDIYGFTVRPHHVKIYKQFAEIYKEEEAERSSRWEDFLVAYSNPIENASDVDNRQDFLRPESNEKKAGRTKFQTWCDVRFSLRPVEAVFRHRPRKRCTERIAVSGGDEQTAEPAFGTNFEDDSDEEFFDAEKVDTSQEVSHGFHGTEDADTGHEVEGSCQWKAELDALVRGGVPMALRGEVWQVFLGSSTRRVPGRYQALLTSLGDKESCSDASRDFHYQTTAENSKQSTASNPAKWTKQIEKDIPRTFPGHPALDVNGRNALRGLLMAYALHNTDVGYCQAMNFFAGLLLLMMPEENAFWTLTGILDDCFEGYYSEKMLEFQVDQMVLEELVRFHFPRLMVHLDALGLQVAWISGPWFLSIFVNVLPWESVLRVWDVLFYEGNRSMLFRTTLALLELYGPAVLAAKDAGDALTTFQALVSETFDSSQLVLTACVGYQSVREADLLQLRKKHLPAVLDMLAEQSMWRKPFGPISFSPNFIECTSAVSTDIGGKLGQGQSPPTKHSNGGNGNANFSSEIESPGSSDISEVGMVENGTMLEDLISQVGYMKLELSGALEDRRVAALRAEELETAFMELVRADNRRLLSAKVETLEAEATHLKQTLADKAEQDQAMIQVMVRMEHELKATQESRRIAEEDAELARNTMKALQVKYDTVMVSLKELESRAVRAEKLLDSTSQHHDLNNGVASTKSPSVTSPGEGSSRWGWSWSTAKVTGEGVEDEIALKESREQHVELSLSRNLLSRTFSFGRHDKSKVVSWLAH